ncbi:MAG: hypothetical protein E7J31_09735 [Clostridium sp.]|uniref:hypothetical protein n=1 Tax=Clostridium sp. TaxID=1506 RepID=UPI00290AACA6|nr:hypothetical protein [Clostridium sp.]MDU7948709.1 hypothetical protein [Clostridium sp.]
MDKTNFKEELKEGLGIVTPQLIDFFVPFMINSPMTTSAVLGISGILSGYRQQRTEKMFKKFIYDVDNKMNNDIEQIKLELSELREDRYNQIKNIQWNLILDYVIENNQEEKIAYMANGFVNLVHYDNFSDDMLLTLYDTLKNLNIIDLKIFNEYYKYIYDRRDTFDNVMRDLNINREQLDLITNKLIREGLIIKIVPDELVPILERIKFSKSLTQEFDYNKPDAIEQILSEKYEYDISIYGEEFRKFFIKNT